MSQKQHSYFESAKLENYELIIAIEYIIITLTTP